MKQNNIWLGIIIGLIIGGIIGSIVVGNQREEIWDLREELNRANAGHYIFNSLYLLHTNFTEEERIYNFEMITHPCKKNYGDYDISVIVSRPIMVSCLREQMNDIINKSKIDAQANKSVEEKKHGK